MSITFAHTLAIFMAFFAIMNPIAGTAIFASLTAGKTKIEQKQIAMKSLIITFSVIFLFSILGKSIFHLFSISLPALRIAGGILVFMIGYHMLQGKSSSLHSVQSADADTALSATSPAVEDEEEGDIAVSPLAVPLLAGPGTIATAMNYSATGGWVEISTTLVMFFLLCIITYICFLFSSKIVRLVGENGLTIVTRLMGLILTVIGIQMLIAGVTTVAHNIM